MHPRYNRFAKNISKRLLLLIGATPASYSQHLPPPVKHVPRIFPLADGEKTTATSCFPFRPNQPPPTVPARSAVAKSNTTIILIPQLFTYCAFCVPFSQIQSSCRKSKNAKIQTSQNNTAGRVKQRAEHQRCQTKNLKRSNRMKKKKKRSRSVGVGPRRSAI